MAWRHGAMLIVVFVAICGVMQVDAGRRREDDVDPRLYKAQHSFRSPFFIGTTSTTRIFLSSILIAAISALMP